MSSSRNQQRGSGFLMVMLISVPMCAAMGLVVDVGWAYFTRQAAHAAAESAALAAAQSALDGIKAGGTYSCGSKGLGCQAATPCPTTIPSPTTSNLQNGCAYAIANGFTDGGTYGQTVTIAANTTSPAPTVPGVQVNYWVTVQITQSNPLSFAAVLAGQSLSIGARATAGVIAAVVQDCIVSLDPTGNKGLTLSGGASVHASSCATQVNSSSTDALDVSGGSQLTSSAVNVVGSANSNGCPSCISPVPTNGAPSITDPYANVPAPSFNSSHCDYTNKSISGTTATLWPGNYCNGITIQGGANVTFNSGTYILIGGGLSITGGSTTNTLGGVTFYNTYNATYAYKAINLSASTSTLSAPTSGTYSGILFFQDRTAQPNGQETFSGGNSASLTGALYFPVTNTQLVFSGGSSSANSNTTIVACDVTFSGASYLGSNSAGSSGPSAPEVALLE